VGAGPLPRVEPTDRRVHSQLLPFVGAAIIIALTPGADTALVVRNALVAGAAPARRTALGTASGLMVWGAASACGVAAVLNASAEAYTTVKLAGAAYLIWLGIQAIRHAGAQEPAGDARSGSPSARACCATCSTPRPASSSPRCCRSSSRRRTRRSWCRCF
jgi:threonine/homoserine/homoserine lactone efflux protein